jgi:hypothetical protein
MLDPEFYFDGIQSSHGYLHGDLEEIPWNRPEEDQLY